MCGIAGILTVDRYQDGLEKTIKQMQAALKHRGPDDEGIYISNNRQAAFAHTRLSILDLSSAGHQPMSTADDRYWITFNGEVYNFHELRQTLVSQGEQFHSHTDTEVILKLYQRMGADCVHQLRGMFAFAIWDDLEKTCFLARDPLGIKPLYYWQSGSTLIFASELRAILKSGLTAISMSFEGLYGYLQNGSVPEPYTLIAGVHCLAAGHSLYWQGENVSQRQYWQINFTPQTISPSDARELVRTAVIDSIHYHFVSDVPVGIFLSGGIDSTTILALAKQTQNEQLSTYSIAFEEPQWNEGAIAQQVADYFGTKHTEYKITSLSAKELFPQFLAAIDQPSVDAFNTFCVSKIAHEDGMKVVLSGLGGDELFGGYPSFQKVPQMLAWRQKLAAVPFASTSLGWGLTHWVNSPKLNRIGGVLERPPSIASAYRGFRGIFSHKEALAIIPQYLETDCSVMSLNLPESGEFSTPEDEVSFLELSYYMRNQLLRDSDVMSMNWGLELRVPLVDRALLETVASIPSMIRLAAGKQVLIEAVPELPRWVVNRPKQGFIFPFDRWMSSEFGEYFNDISIPKHISLEPWSRRWSLAMLKYWWTQVTA